MSSKDPAELDKYAKEIYDWIKSTSSRIRMLMSYQGAGGLPYGASVHHRATHCFIVCGNKYHDGDGDSVSLTEFHEAIKSRHRLGSHGIGHSGDDSPYFK